MIERPKLIIFDCDGVLVDSEPATNELLAQRLTACGLPMTRDEAVSMFVGGTIKSVAEKARSMGADLPDDWVTQTYEAMFDRMAKGLPDIPHLDQVFAALDKAGIQTCIASNGPMRKMNITLPNAGLMERFEGRIFSAHDVGIAKPDPGLFLHAAKTLGATPDTSVVIEDSASGAKAAAAAGMRCFGYTADTPAEKLTAHGAIPFASMVDLPGLLGL